MGSRTLPAVTSQTKHKTKKGFTLIELSIVLVIVALIVGGILEGQNLINSSVVRAQISQFQSYMSAVNAFKDKYGYLPGDIPSSMASQYGFAARNGSVGRGDGNGLIEGAQANGNQAMGEDLLFWNDLSTANLIDGKFTGQDCSYGNCTVESTPAAVYTVLPFAKIGRGNVINIVPTANNGNAFAMLANVTSLTAVGGITTTNPLGYSPAEAFAIDTKMDDGFPTTGHVLSISGWGTTGAPNAGAAGAGSAGHCGDTDTTPTTYNASITFGDVVICQISVQFQ